MRRDLDVCRSILLELQAKHGGMPLFFSFYEGEKIELTGQGFMCPIRSLYQYNFELLIEANFIKGEARLIAGGTARNRLEIITWQGHDFLDHVENHVIWEKFRNKFGGELVNASMKEVASRAVSFISSLLN